jgi:phage tail-like protein
VFRCWVAEYTAQPELDANANSIAFETIVLRNEGWERDTNVVEVPET